MAKVLKNKFGNVIKITDCRKLDKYMELREAKLRHLKAVRDRYMMYVIDMPKEDDRVVANMIKAEVLYKQMKRTMR